MFFKGVIIVAAIALVVILWAVFSQELSDPEGLQNAIDACTNEIDNMGSSGSDLESCLNDAYNQYLAYHEGQTGYSRGNYNGKGWLIVVANEVQAMANRYEAQLRACI